MAALRITGRTARQLWPLNANFYVAHPQRLSWQHMVAPIASVLLAASNIERPRPSISRHLRGGVAAGGCAPRPCFHFARAQERANYGEALRPVGPFETKATGGRCAQDLGPEDEAAGTHRAHGKIAALYLTDSKLKSLVLEGGVEPPRRVTGGRF